MIRPSSEDLGHVGLRKVLLEAEGVVIRVSATASVANVAALTRAVIWSLQLGRLPGEASIQG